MVTIETIHTGCWHRAVRAPGGRVVSRKFSGRSDKYFPRSRNYLLVSFYIEEMHLGSLSLLSKRCKRCQRCQVTWQRQYVKMHILIHHYCRDFTDRYYSIVQTVRTNIDFNISMMRKNSQMRIISRSKRPRAAYLLVAVERASTF